MPKLPENCPIRGNKMEKGYVNSGSEGIFWTKEKHTQRVPLDVETLIGHRFLGFSIANVEANRCPNCKLVLFSYGEEKKNE